MVDAVSIWRSVISSFEETLTDHSIRIKASFESDEMMVSANPLLLDKVFATAVQLLLEDAFDDSELRVDFTRGTNGISCLFSNEGGGTPIEALRRSLQAAEKNDSSAATDSTSDALQQNLTPAQRDQFAEIEGWVVSWGGAVSVVSQPQCMSVTIDLLGKTAKSNVGSATPAQAHDTGTKSEA